MLTVLFYLLIFQSRYTGKLFWSLICLLFWQYLCQATNLCKIAWGGSRSISGATTVLRWTTGCVTSLMFFLFYIFLTFKILLYNVDEYEHYLLYIPLHGQAKHANSQHWVYNIQFSFKITFSFLVRGWQVIVE